MMKGNGFSLMTVMFILLTLLISKQSVLEDLSLMMMSMTGKKGKIVRVLTYLSTKILLKI